MVIIPIREYGDPILRKKARTVDKINEDLLVLARDMVDTMYDAKGAGLAAPQVGVSLSLCVIDLSLGEERGHSLVMINPEILYREGNATIEEGCLSVPDIRTDVTRAEKVSVRFQNLEGNLLEMTCDGMLARAIQHEYDHLQGVLFVDRLGQIKKQFLKRKLKEISEKWKEADYLAVLPSVYASL